jgi:aminoglycoside phosphotransferase (APT) family kinase protein
MVVKCGVGTIAKLVWGAEEFTEYTTLQYLLEHKLSIPAPRLLGLLRMGRVTIFFLSYLSGTTVEAVWADLGTDQKASVRDQLDVIFRDLRAMEFPRGMPLGGVAGEGCKDQRRHLRRSTTPIFDVKDFETFQFSNPKYGSLIFIDFLRAFTPRSSCQIVFTHGDLRPENVIVEVTEDNRYIVGGLIDWEGSGFYPEYYEATKNHKLSGNE